MMANADVTRGMRKDQPNSRTHTLTPVMVSSEEAEEGQKSRRPVSGGDPERFINPRTGLRNYRVTLKYHLSNRSWTGGRRVASGNRVGDKVDCPERHVGHYRKARLVARGFAQRPGLDFSETFAPVTRLGSVRILIALAAERGLNVRQFDVATAYLNGELEETVLMEIPKYTEKALENIVHTMLETMPDEIGKGNRVCLLNKALDGLRQAGRCWNNRVNRELANYGARKSSTDPCVSFKGSGENLIIISAHVDDILVASRNEREIINFGRHLSSVFEVSDLGDVNYCLGMEFARHGDEITICQAGYVKDVLERFGMTDCKPGSTPIEPGSQLTKSNDDPSPEEEGLSYRELIGSLMYLAVCTRPDIAYAVSSLSQFCACFRSEHWLAAKRVLRYLKGSKNMGLEYHRTGKPLLGYVDADWANCPTDRRSYTGHVYILGGCPVSWESRKQRSVALSSTEAEYMALSEAAKEATYLRRFLVELGFAEIAGVRVFCDIGARKLAENPVFHGRRKHIDVRHHYVREIIENGDVEVAYMPNADMAADVLTKGVPKQKQIKYLDAMGLTRIGSSE